jgi:aryl-alcohol dehydrogenase-like predicted oxidoreductase
MQQRPLGNTDVKVSLICLGTMTWGQQNTEAEAHQQMDYAVEEGINFFDTAELYPVPPLKETQGRTEQYIGSWFKKSGKRDEIVLATKVVGRTDMNWFRGEEARLHKRHIHEALEASLKRLQTDYVDLYQLHWPDRKTNYFGQLGYTHDAKDDAIPLRETLQALAELVKTGKVRHIGLSNETPWGLAKCLELAREHGLPRVVSVQNPYNLLNRSYEIGLAEMSIREQAGLLAYSPLAFGMLTGKYRNGARPEGSRITLYTRFGRYLGAKSLEAIDKYCAIAEAYELTPTQMALAFVNRQPFVTSNIIGATSMEQLKENIGSLRVKLSPEILAEINAVHAEISNPAP